MSLKIGIVDMWRVARQNYLPCLAVQDDVEPGYYNRTRAKADDVAVEFGGSVFEVLVQWCPDAVVVLTKETDRFDASAE